MALRAAPARPADVEREYHGLRRQLDQLEDRRQTPLERLVPGRVRRLTASAADKLEAKDYTGALRDADAALELDPDNPRALYDRAAAHNLLGNYAQAARDASLGLIASPTDTALLDVRAWAYNRLDLPRKAADDARRALELDPRDAYALANLADADEQLGDVSAMVEHSKAAAEMDARFEPAYRDAARRHGMRASPIPADRRAPSLFDRLPARTLSLAAILLVSLLGALLAAAAVLHLLEDGEKKPAAGYELGRALGQGGMGVVYEAVDRALRRPVAVKVLRDEFKLDDGAKARFIEEARTVAELSHPAIVDIHAVVEDEGGVCLVFERLKGRTLDEILAHSGRLDLAETKRILRPVCDGLDYAHARGVVHRDLKPANVMLLDDGSVKLLDFGISSHAANRHRTDSEPNVAGTPPYMSPEQSRGCVRKENDVFSLGAVLYEMLTGRRPLDDSPRQRLARSSGLPPGLDDLIDRALEPDPEKRIPSPSEFWRRLDSI